MTLARSLLVYRVLAYIVGVMLIIVFCTIPFSGVEQVVGPIHGVLYIVYLAAALNLVIRARLGLWTLVAMVTARLGALRGLRGGALGDTPGDRGHRQVVTGRTTPEARRPATARFPGRYTEEVPKP